MYSNNNKKETFCDLLDCELCVFVCLCISCRDLNAHLTNNKKTTPQLTSLNKKLHNKLCMKI